MRPALIHKEQPLWLHHRSYHHSPGCSLELVVALGSYSPPFFLLGPMRAMARHMVERLTESPVNDHYVLTAVLEGEVGAFLEILFE
jgi:hypothetical protein